MLSPPHPPPPARAAREGDKVQQRLPSCRLQAEGPPQPPGPVLASPALDDLWPWPIPAGPGSFIPEASSLTTSLHLQALQGLLPGPRPSVISNLWCPCPHQQWPRLVFKEKAGATGQKLSLSSAPHFLLERPPHRSPFQGKSLDVCLQLSPPGPIPQAPVTSSGSLLGSQELAKLTLVDPPSCPKDHLLRNIY